VGLVSVWMLRAISLMGVFARYNKSMLVLKLVGAWGGLPLNLCRSASGASCY
jgi:hypothetical protein